jgi:hypothetical protein
MVQHDMMMFDHGMPGPDGNLNPEQRREADVNIEFQENSKMAAASHKLASLFKNANARYATDYPATVGPYMQSTDSVPFQDIIPAISLRENERRDHIGFGWDPLASADRRLFDLHGQGLPPWPQCGPDDPCCDRAAVRRAGQDTVIGSPGPGSSPQDP